MKQRVVAILLCLSLMGLPVRAADQQDAVERLLAGMRTEEKIAQMLMPTFRTDPGRGEGIGEEVAACLREYGFAGVVLFAEELETTEQAVRRTDAMQAANAIDGRPQLLLAVDQEGGSITRLGQGTMTCGNMALGAVNDPKATGQIAAILGEEILACGLNVDFAPVLDVNSDPENPVIGIRSFSDDPGTVAEQGAAFLAGLSQAGAIACPKHFPGHGDTGTDSHTGLPRVDKDRETLLREDLLPFARCVEAGAEMLMTAHIQYPAIETETCLSRATGEAITLPATLSQAVITGLLRGELGFEGVVVTDALGMDAIQKHFSAADSARLAIEAGVDILLMPPVETSALGGYIDMLAGMADAGELSMEKVDAAVRRILLLKQRHGLLAPYETGRVEERLAAAKTDVGSAGHRETEWEIAKRAVTLVKNDGVLPYSEPLGRTVVLTANDNEIASMEYALRRLREEEALPEEAEVEVYSLPGASAELMASWTAGADHVIAVSELYSSAGLFSSASARLDTLIAIAHANGADVTVVSAFLPYDAARYPDADAFALCWLDRAMSEDPRVSGGGTAQYGPNLPACLYLLLSGASPRGTLSVEIPALNEDGSYSDEVLYPRGFGLRYPGAEIDEVEDIDGFLKEYESEVEGYVDYLGNIDGFKDLNGRAWYYADVRQALEEGWMRPASDAAFAPGRPVNAAAVLDALYRMTGAGEDDPILWARDMGLLAGLEPGETVTRRQLAQLLYRYVSTVMVLDEDEAPDPMAWAETHGLFRRRARFAPEAPVTRAVLAHALCALRDAAGMGGPG